MPKKEERSTFLDGFEANFETLREAVLAGRLALLECKERTRGGKKVAVVVALNRDPATGETEFVPLARMFEGNPYDQLCPPNPEGGFHEEPSEATPTV